MIQLIANIVGREPQEDENPAITPKIDIESCEAKVLLEAPKTDYDKIISDSLKRATKHALKRKIEQEILAPTYNKGEREDTQKAANFIAERLGYELDPMEEWRGRVWLSHNNSKGEEEPPLLKRKKAQELRDKAIEKFPKAVINIGVNDHSYKGLEEVSIVLGKELITYHDLMEKLVNEEVERIINNAK